MNLTSKSFIKNLLMEKGVHPSKKLGQNFLISRTVLEKILGAAELKKSDTILEIGPGIGTLTKELAKKTKEVIAIEKDKKMIEILKETLKDFRNVKIFQGDVLKIEPKSYKLQAISYKLISNLPYYITSPVIRKFLESDNPPGQMILMVQKEVAQRIRARPPKMSILAVSVQFYAKPEIISYVSKKSFWPQPKVDSAILRIAPLIDADRKPINAELFFKIVRVGFSHPRKQLVNNLVSGLELDKEKTKLWLLKSGINPTQRAQTLQTKDWINLSKNFKDFHKIVVK